MNTIREIQKLNQRELENVVPPSASWHTDYRDTAYIHVGGLSFDLTEGDIVTIFSQYGEPVWLKLARDKETGKSKGYAWLKYEDQRSCDLAVDNLGGALILGRTVKVDHTRYKKREDEEDDDEAFNLKFEGEDEDSKPSKRRRGSGSESDEDRPLLKEELELEELIRNHDDDDPMKAYLIDEKKEEVATALAKQDKHRRKSKDASSRRKHKSHSGRDKHDRDREDRHGSKHSRRNGDERRNHHRGRDRKRDHTSGRNADSLKRESHVDHDHWRRDRQ